MNVGVLAPPARRFAARRAFRHMTRLSLLITIVVLLVAPASAVASPEQIYDDCQDNGRLDKRYADSDYRKALRDMPEDLDEYTNCRDLVRAGLDGVDTTSGAGDPTAGAGAGGGTTGGTGGSSGGSAPRDLPQGNGVGSVPLGPEGKPLNPEIDAAPEERKELNAARSGDIRPTSAGVRPGEPDGEMPAPLLALLIVAGIAGLAGGGMAVWQTVRTPPTHPAA
jgi:hypothetical protein